MSIVYTYQLKEIIDMKKSNTRLLLEKEYRKLAKRADQRLLRLEEYAGRKGFSGILSFAYRVAKRDIRSWSGDTQKKPRFNTAPPKNTNQLKAKIADISDECAESCEIQLKYAGYIKREQNEAAKLQRLDQIRIPDHFNFDEVQSLSTEARQKLSRIRPNITPHS